MIDLHTHTLFSDGELLPSELVRRADIRGYSAIAITDHADASNIDFIVPRIVKVAGELNAAGGIKVIPGIELTHVPPSQIKGLIQEARRLGAKLVVVHGETPVEPVICGAGGFSGNPGDSLTAGNPGTFSVIGLSLDFVAPDSATKRLL